VKWQPLPGAMLPLDTGDPYYWAPEVTYYRGKFYLYYSVGNETLMSIRVAVADDPTDEFIDAGISLTTREFAIDPHVFVDDDGRRYLFYATDFLDYSHIGTGTVVNEMLGPYTLKGAPRPVTRAKYDWQVYNAARKEKGGVRWHTVEGPFVLKRKGTYYEMFSGGNWQNVSYGVSFAVSDDLDRDEEWTQFSDGVTTLPVLSTLPGRVIGPGHNSVVKGPNGRELYCVYHRWESGERVMAIDRMDFAGGGRLFLVGPTFTSQIAPYQPAMIDDFSALDTSRWAVGHGEWGTKDRELRSHSEFGEITINTDCQSFLCSLDLKLENTFTDGEAGLVLRMRDGTAAFIVLGVSGGEANVFWSCGTGSKVFDIPAGLDITSFSNLLIEVDTRLVNVTLGGQTFNDLGELTSDVLGIGLYSKGPAAFSTLRITNGFEDLFVSDDLELRGWQVNDEGRFSFEDGSLRLIGDSHGPALLSRQVSYGYFDLAVNLRIQGPICGLESVTINRSTIEQRDGWKFISGECVLALPDEFRPGDFHQFRFVALDKEVTAYLDGTVLGSIHDTARTEELRISVDMASVYLDMVRYTLI
jgi:hypothetical protein